MLSHRGVGLHAEALRKFQFSIGDASDGQVGVVTGGVLFQCLYLRCWLVPYAQSVYIYMKFQFSI